MSQDNSLFKDLARLANSAIANLSNAKNAFTDLIKHQLTMLLSDMNFVTREEFEVIKKIAIENKLQMDKLMSQNHMQKNPETDDTVQKQSIEIDQKT